MKNNIKILLFALLLLAVGGFNSCDRESSALYDMTGGVPEVYYIRVTDPLKADSLIVGAFMEEAICLVGNNLTSIQEIYFNDQKALLNQNFITKNTLIVSVPKTIPDDVTNKMYLITGDGETVSLDFAVGIPAPIVGKVKCEHVPEGQEVIITGDYFFDYADAPIEITISGYKVPYESIVSVEKTRVSFLAPPADVKGYISIKTSYGSNTPSYKDIFRDMSGLITSFEDSENGGSGFAGGWGRPAASDLQEDPEYALTGKYLKWEGAVTAGEWSGWNILNIWSSANSDIPDPMFTGDLETHALKFELNVVEPWSALPMIFCFSADGSNEDYLWADGTQPRAFYAPWTTEASGSYVSDGWTTVTIPLSEMKYNGSEATVDLPTAFGQLGISLHNRGGASYVGTDCSPVMLIDNIRVVSIE